LIGEDNKNFKRKLIQNIDKVNSWLSPINLQIQIAPKRKSVQKERKEKE